MGRADWLDRPAMGHVLAALMPANRLVMECCMATGLRVGDVLALKTADVQHGSRMTVREQKTGKSRRVYWPAELRLRMLQQAGRVWVFEGRNDWRKHRTRSAVYKDLQRAARVFRASGVVPKGAQVSTHTGRKIRAVDEFRRTWPASGRPCPCCKPGQGPSGWRSAPPRGRAGGGGSCFPFDGFMLSLTAQLSHFGP